MIRNPYLPLTERTFLYYFSFNYTCSWICYYSRNW